MIPENTVRIPGFDGYRISKKGDIWSIHRGGNWKLKSVHPGKSGYIKTSLRERKGVYKSRFVHRLVWISFVGDIPKEKEINHKDGDKSNNNIENLECVDHRENVRHAHFCELNNCDHLSKHWKDRDVRKYEAIRILYSEGFTQTEIALLFGMSQAGVSHVLSGRNDKLKERAIKRNRDQG